jgi:ethanolaminephosphotransferase
MDGKQARRTGSSSSLGQFFDHGCDAITTVCEMMKVSASLRFGNTAASFCFIFFTCTGFLLTAYQEFVTHTFYLGYLNAPTEGVLLLVTAQISVGLWPSLHPWIENKFVFWGYLVLGGWTQAYCIFDVVNQSIKDKTGEKGRRAIIGIIPGVISVGIFIGLLWFDQGLVTNLCFTMAAGFVLVYQAQQVIVAHVIGASAKTFFNAAVVIAWLVAIGGFFGVSVAGFASYWHFALIVEIALVLIWDTMVIVGLARGLQIPVFTLPKKAQ